jgi:hypothetical protein
MCNRGRVSHCSANTRRWDRGRSLLPLLCLAGCAIGAGVEDDGWLDSLDATVQTAPPPVVDAGPVYTPLPPELGLPTTPTVPVGRPDGGTATRTPTGTGTRATNNDAGASRPQQGRDAGSARPSTGCVESACKNTCALDGPFNCCTLLDTCGCTWAPGAYCL